MGITECCQHQPQCHQSFIIMWHSTADSSTERIPKSIFESSLFDECWNIHFIPFGSCLKVVYLPSANPPHKMKNTVKKICGELDYRPKPEEIWGFLRLILYYTIKIICFLSTYDEVGSGEWYDLLHTSKIAFVKIPAYSTEWTCVAMNHFST